MEASPFTESAMARVSSNVSSRGTTSWLKPAREKKGLFRSADVALGACMQGNRGNVEPQKSHVLDYQGVGSRAVQLFYQAFNIAQLRIIHDGVECHVDPGVETVGIVGNACYVGHRIGGSLTRAVAFGTDINGIGAMFYGFDCCRGITGRGKQLYSVRCHDFCFYAKVHKKRSRMHRFRLLYERE